MTRVALPIDAAVPDLVARLERRGALVVTASPGSGKTTRLPAALLDAATSAGQEHGEIWVLEPRRIAARAAASRVAEERSSRLGDEVGYIVRDDAKRSRATRLCFLTEGVLVAAITKDPELKAVGTVILDEIHERHVETDLALAMLRDVRATLRPDLRLVAMSATLDAERVATYLDADLVDVKGTLHDVETVWDAGHDDRPLELRVASGVREALAWLRQHAPFGAGVLVFLPGKREIDAAMAAVYGLSEARDFEVLPLHGALSAADQERALRASGRPKIVLATNVAESSVTVEGIRAVVDSGLARVLRKDGRSGFDRLRLENIARASADQRRGRAGRLGPGLCRRLWVRGEERQRPAHADPELRRVDVTRAWLDVRCFAGKDAESFAWFDAPPAEEVTAADVLLRRLGALDAEGRVTAIGHAMHALPLAPRLARLVVEARERHCVRRAAALAALLQEGSEQRRDLLGATQAVLDGRLQGRDRNAIRSAMQGLQRRVRANTLEREGEDSDEALQACLLAAFPDHVAARKLPNDETAHMATGLRIQVLPELGLPPDCLLFLALGLHGVGSRPPRPGYVLAVDEGDLDVTLIDEREVLAVDEAQGRVRLVRKRSYSSITLSEVVVGEADPRAAKPLLAPLFLANPRRWLGKQATLDEVMSRVAWLQGRGATEVPDVSLEALAPWLLDFVDAKQGLKSLGSIDVGAALLAARADLRARLERDAPSSVRLPNGRVAAIDYAREVGPTVSARVQELFGSRGLPALLGGRQPLVIELLGPNYRPVQITSDLEGFWLRTYKSVRAELRRRYPKHAWPEDPLTATPETRPRR